MVFSLWSLQIATKDQKLIAKDQPSHQEANKYMTTELLQYIGILIVSLAVLVKASDFFVEAAEKIGLALGIPPFIIGVTIVAFGTSLPELASSIAAVNEGMSDVVIGNVVGSNIANIALVLGLVAIIGKDVKMNDFIMHVDIPLLVISAFLLWFVVEDGNVSIFDAIVLLAALVIFLVHSLKGNSDDSIEKTKIGWKTIVLLLVSAVFIKFGADYTVEGIKGISLSLGIGSAVIAQSLVALGTSLPEVFVSFAAAKQGQTDMAIGNVLGSNIFNTYAVTAIPAFIGPLVIPPAVLTFSLPYMIALTIILGLICITKTISRWEGLMLMLLYLFFLVKLYT